MELSRRGVLIGLSVSVPLVSSAVQAAVPAPLWGVVATADGPWRSRIVHLNDETPGNTVAATASPPKLRTTFIDLPDEAYIQAIG